MTHWMNALRAAQLKLSNELATKLFDDLKKTDDFAAIAAQFLGLPEPEPTDKNADPDIIASLIASHVSVATLEAIHGYTDWATTQIARAPVWPGGPLPKPTMIDIALIAKTYGVAPLMVVHVVAEMLKRPSLPLLGERQSNGCDYRHDWKMIHGWVATHEITL